jgi:hypothetical protein
MTTEQRNREACLRVALERIANSEIPGVSGGPNGPSAQVMEFAQTALAATPEQSNTLPAGITREECDVIGECQECGRESGEDYTMHVPAGQWESWLSQAGWAVMDGCLLCWDCS